MKEKINIAEILKDKAECTKLYSPICGECKLSYVESEKSEPQISTESDAFGVFYFWDDGKAYNEGECLFTDSEKQQLFSALEKEGKAWDSEHKMIVDLKPKVEFKPMDLCLMKYIGRYNNRGWELCQYAYTEHRVSSSGEQRYFYHSVGGEIYAECIPYNEDTKHLLGTRDKWKGGEG